jgi:hypothetical protein
VELARESGTVIRRKPEDIYDNSFVFNLEKSGFLGQRKLQTLNLMVTF